MGRDFAPYEHYLSEQSHIQKGYGDLFDFLEKLKIIYEDGKEVVCCSPEEMAVRRQFPQLGRLLMDHDFMVLYEKLSKIDGGIELLHQRDDELGALLGASKVSEPEPNHSVIKINDIGIDKDSYLIKWFAGKLDEHFYYAERNNQLFVEEMVNDALTINYVKDIKKQLETKENTTSYGEPQAWVSLDNGRSIEVTYEQDGLEEKDYFYSVFLHCTEREFDNNDYASTNGVIVRYNSKMGDSIDSLSDLVRGVLRCNDEEPIEEHSKPSLDEKIGSAESRVSEPENKTQIPEVER